VNSTSGLDVAASYTHPLFDGAVTWELNGNYTDQQTRNSLGVTYDSAGALGASPDAYASGIPKLRAVLAATYQGGPWSLTAQGRFIGAARLTNGPEGVAGIASASLSSAGVLTRGDILGLVDDNDIGAVGYMDLRASYRWSAHLQVYGAIDNVTDVAPPQIVSTSGGTGTNQMVYDALGRAIRMGVRIND
jgi:iron complex outermembrane recepter protein